MKVIIQGQHEDTEHPLELMYSNKHKLNKGDKVSIDDKNYTVIRFEYTTRKTQSCEGKQLMIDDLAIVLAE